MSNTDLTQLNSSINTFIKILKGTVNDKKFDYDDKGLDDAIDYATQLMRDKKPVNFEWHDEYEKEVFIEKILGVLTGLLGSTKASREKIKKDVKKEVNLQKLDPAMAALAGWWLGGTIDEINQQRGQLSPSQQREFDRQVEQALRRQDRSFRKDISLEKLQYFFKTKPINPGSAAPPKAGLTWDPTSHRWVNPKTRAKGAIAARGGKKRVRGTGTGVGEKKVKAGRKLAEGRKHRGAADIGEKPKKFKLPKIQ